MANQALAGRVASKIVDQLGPGVLDKLASKFLGGDDGEDEDDREPATPAAAKTRTASAPATARSAPEPAATKGAGAGAQNASKATMKKALPRLRLNSQAALKMLFFICAFCGPGVYSAA